MNTKAHVRTGVLVMESAIVLPVFLMLLIGFIVGALGVFRFQEVSGLAREGARYASVHGNTYAYMTMNPAPTAEQIYNTAIVPRMVALNRNRMTYNITWQPDKNQGSLVKVQLSYQWIPELYFGGINLRTTAIMPVSY